MSNTIRQLVEQRRIEEVAPNTEHAQFILKQAAQHVRTAQALAGTEDQAMAFTAAYDAARKALTAVLAAHGLRVRPNGGAHRNTGIAAAEFVSHPSLAEFEWMRHVRNATEYPSEDRAPATALDVRDGIEAAEEIVSACRDHIHDALASSRS